MPQRGEGVFVSENGEDRPVIMDIDAYYQSDALANANINEWLMSANLKAFDVYKYCMKESYLETISE